MMFPLLMQTPERLLAETLEKARLSEQQMEDEPGLARQAERTIIFLVFPLPMRIPERLSVCLAQS
jgi:hypothetical protein